MPKWKRRIANAVAILLLMVTSSYLAWWFYAISKPYLGALCLGLVLGLAAAPSLQRWPFFRRMAPMPGGRQTEPKPGAIRRLTRKWWPFANRFKEARP